MRRKAWVVSEVRATNRCQEASELALLIVQRQNEPAAIAALIMIRQGIGRLRARGAMRYVLAEQARLRVKWVAPDIEVPFALPYADGADPQFDRAVEEMARVLESRKDDAGSRG